VPRSVARPLLFAAAVALVAVASVDLTVVSRVAASSNPTSIWIRSSVDLVLWCALVALLQKTLERRDARRLDADVAAMSFERALSLVVAELARHPEDPRVLKELHDAATADWFRSTAV